MSAIWNQPMLARGIDGDFLRGLWNGEASSWMTVGAVVVIIFGMYIAQRYFGFKVPDRKARRQARHKRKIVLWEYDRDAKRGS